LRRSGGQDELLRSPVHGLQERLVQAAEAPLSPRATGAGAPGRFYLTVSFRSARRAGGGEPRDGGGGGGGADPGAHGERDRPAPEERGAWARERERSPWRIRSMKWRRRWPAG